MAPKDKRDIAGQPFAGIPPQQVGNKIPGITLGPVTPAPTNRDGSSPYKVEDPRRQEDSAYSPMDAMELHRRSDVDSSKLAQHHTLGVAPNQGSPGNHHHDGVDSLQLPVTSLAGGITGQVFNWTPVWTAETTNPTLGNGQFLGMYCRIGPMVFVTYKLLMRSTTTYGNGRYRFSLPPGLPDYQGGGTGYELVGHMRNTSWSDFFPVVAYVNGGRISDIWPSTQKEQGREGLTHTGYKGAWVADDEIQLTGWYVTDAA